MSDYKPKVVDVIGVYGLLPLTLILAISGDEYVQQEFLYPFKILASKVKQLTNYLGRVL